MPGGATRIRIGTRGSPLARWQANWVAERLRGIQPELEIELVEIKTRGDRDRSSAPSAAGEVGLFTKEIQRSVRDMHVDAAVHSLKDLPTQEPPELTVAAVPVREDVADALVAPQHQTLHALPRGALIGTSSARRRAQLLFVRPDLKVVTLRGNVETRLHQALQGRLDAIVLAWAGLRRLGLERYVTQRLEPPAFLPAAGQGALGLECRRDDAAMAALLLQLEDPAARRAVEAERATLAELRGGCTLSLAAWARDVEDSSNHGDGTLLALDATVFAPDGGHCVTGALRGSRDDPWGLGRRVAQVLRDQGAEPLLREVL